MDIEHIKELASKLMVLCATTMYKDKASTHDVAEIRQLSERIRRATDRE